mgnify:CR=1 FL=1
MGTKLAKKHMRTQAPVAVGMGLVALDIVFTADDETPPRIPPVANKAQALQRTEALLQQLLAHRNDPAQEAPRELSDKELA